MLASHQKPDGACEGNTVKCGFVLIWWVIEGSERMCNIWSVMHIHELIIHHDLNTLLEI